MRWDFSWEFFSLVVPPDSRYSVCRVPVLEGSSEAREIKRSIIVKVDTTREKLKNLKDAMVELDQRVSCIHIEEFDGFINALYGVFSRYFPQAEVVGPPVKAIDVFELDKEELCFFIMEKGGFMDTAGKEFLRERERIIGELEKQFSWFVLMPKNLEIRHRTYSLGEVMGCLTLGVVSGSSGDQLCYKPCFYVSIFMRGRRKLNRKKLKWFERAMGEVNGVAFYPANGPITELGVSIEPPYETREVERWLRYGLFRLSPDAYRRSILQDDSLACEWTLMELSI
uniref:Uncharacterized protein n=1 Tax=Candidatus Caldatribacterium californiense TaxID=1454726 RepID=A0A7V4DGJ4_9BACT